MKRFFYLLPFFLVILFYPPQAHAIIFLPAIILIPVAQLVAFIIGIFSVPALGLVALIHKLFRASFKKTLVVIAAFLTILGIALAIFLKIYTPDRPWF